MAGARQFGTNAGAASAPRDECYVYNDVGHSVLLVDGGGEPVQANLYGAFGEVLRAWGDSRNDRLGNTKDHDRATGLANHGFRYYDPSTGRYLSEDPLGYEV